MKVEPSTTVSELQIGLAKLGIDSMVWKCVGDQHAVTVSNDSVRCIGYGALMIGALNDAVHKFVMHVGADVAIDFHGSKIKHHPECNDPNCFGGC